MVKVFFLLFFYITLFFASEPSAFEAGNLEKNSPYGLTSTEKHIYQNKKDIAGLRKEVFVIKQELSELEEKVQGLQSITEGVDERVNKLEKSSSKEEIERLRSELNATKAYQKEQFAQMKKILTQMSSLIDSINSNYVSKDELNKELKKIYSLLQKDSSKKSNIESKSGYVIFKEAREAYRSKDYKKAKELFLIAIKKGYKPATSSFYIGESCYYSKDYECAITYYKKSASIYQKSKFMPTLLLHTAISLDRLGKKGEAKKFYESVIKLYLDSKAAKIAKKNLSKIKN